MIKTLAITVACACLAVLLLVYFGQAKLIFRPSRNVHADPSEHGFKFENIWLTTADGIKLHGWFVPHAEALGTVLFFHGNGGNIADRPLTVARLNGMRLNVFLIDYRGYGRSEGTPRVGSTLLDAKAAWNYLTQERGIAPDNIVLYGRSLGGAVALELIEHTDPAAIILESTFTSLAEMARATYPYLPTRLLLRYRYPSLERIRHIIEPVFIAHSVDDELIPFVHGERLYAAAEAAKSKTFYRLAGIHNRAFVHGGEAYYQALEQFIIATLANLKATIDPLNDT